MQNKELPKIPTLGERVRWARKNKDLSQKELANLVNSDQTQIGKLERNTINKPRNLNNIAKALDVPEAWLAYGSIASVTYELRGKQDDKGRYVVEEMKELESYGIANLPTPPLPAFAVDIKVFDAPFSMGEGNHRPDSDTVIDHMRLSSQWLRENITFSRPDNLAVITGYGDSMAPTYNDGDILLVDCGVDQIKLDAVYVLAFKERLFIKRIQRRPDGDLIMISDNSYYEPYKVSKQELQDLQVYGRVVYAWNGKNSDYPPHFSK